ncbi:hypothetical protein CPB85DRAFT_1311636 [Mucidula mucida]|nr:hypothetical protein CPB85DRAFT_1311636 [Mucidula mucida]
MVTSRQTPEGAGPTCHCLYFSSSSTMTKHVPVVILDNGASTIKCCTVPQGNTRFVPNAIIRSKGDKTTYFGHEFTTERCKDFASLSYRLPFEKGYLVDWDAQKSIWDGIFSEDVLNVDTTESSLLVTEPYFNLPNIQEVYDQFVFEEYEFKSYYRCTPASLVPHAPAMGLPPPECMLLIDSGFSFTHVVPLLCNYIMNCVKESCCFVSDDFGRDLEACRNDIVREYILPDMSKNRSGRIRLPDDILADSDQVLVMNNERLNQTGLPGAVAASIALLPEDLRGLFWANVRVFGGNTKFPGFSERLLSELRSLAPTSDEVCIYDCENPITAPLDGALNFVQTSAYQDGLITREEYLEGGSNAIRRKWKGPGPEAPEKIQPPKNLVVSVSIPTRRGPGRPPKNSTVEVGMERRGPGRPRKRPPTPEEEVMSVPARRGPGRPRKNPIPT